MFDHGFLAVRDSNGGGGMKIGLLDVPGTWHYATMLAVINVVAPKATVISSIATSDTDLANICVSEVARLAGLGCIGIAMPFIIPGITAVGQFPAMDNIMTEADANGCLLFGAVGDGTAQTGYPALHGSVFGCGAITGQGAPLPNGTSQAGNCQLGLVTASSSQASVMALCLLADWMKYGQYTHGQGYQRHNGWWHFCTDTGVASQRGIAPMVGRLV